jgi:hypothetical protein
MEDEKVKKLMQSVKSPKSRCDDPKPSCCDCSVGKRPQNVGGYTEDATGKINVCSNKADSAADVRQILTHELVHARDRCLGISQRNTCQQRACLEIRALRYAGNCRDGGYNRDPNNPRETEQDCVIRVTLAALSDPAKPMCTQQDVIAAMAMCSDVDL